MTATIAYDKPVANFIDRLTATGHVTRTAYKKKNVTFHHNAGRLSHQGILDVWKVRPASAHFDVDSSGAVAQYVAVNHYAWAAGNLKGNQESIHIELANSSGGPDWLVGDATWKSGARLAGWLFFRVIGVRPTKSLIKQHSDWSATTCPGPFMKKTMAKVLTEAQKAYDSFKKSAEKPPAKPATKTINELAKEVMAGRWGNGSERINRLKAAGYQPAKVQAEVDRIKHEQQLDKQSPAVVEKIAKEVIAGKWGNNPERARKLRDAGYNTTAVQEAVNRLMT